MQPPPSFPSSFVTPHRTVITSTLYYVGSKVFYDLDCCSSFLWDPSFSPHHPSSHQSTQYSGSLGRRETSFRSLRTHDSLEGSLPVQLWAHANSQGSPKSSSHPLCHCCLSFEHAISDPRAFALAVSSIWNAPPVTSLP